MIERGIKFYRKEYLTTITEKYHDKLVSWFCEKCYTLSGYLGVYLYSQNKKIFN